MRLIARSSVLVLVSQLIIYCPPVLAQGAPGADTEPVNDNGTLLGIN